MLDQYFRNLRIVEKQMSQLGPGDAAWVTLENQKRDYLEKIKDLRKKTHGKYYSAQKKISYFIRLVTPKQQDK